MFTLCPHVLEICYFHCFTGLTDKEFALSLRGDSRLRLFSNARIIKTLVTQKDSLHFHKRLCMQSCGIRCRMSQIRFKWSKSLMCLEDNCITEAQQVTCYQETGPGWSCVGSYNVKEYILIPGSSLLSLFLYCQGRSTFPKFQTILPHYFCISTYQPQH